MLHAHDTKTFTQWDQFSIIARFEGSNKDLENELVIVGAHQDSVNMWLPSFGRSPGADVSWMRACVNKRLYLNSVLSG